MMEERASPFPDTKNVFRLVFSVIALAGLSTLSPKVEAASVPAHFKSYSMTDIGGGLRCIAGDTTNEGADGRAYVYLVDLTSHKMRWITKIPLPPNRYQNRATHCLADGNKVYAVVQSDTSPSQALSQTFVDVATLDKSTGQLVSTAKVIAPEAGRAPSTWVDDGANNFRMENGKIVVTGQFFNLDNPDVRKPFIASPTP